MQPIPKAQLVWITTINPGAGTQFNFPDVPELNARRIIGLEAFTATQLTNTPDGTAVIPAADALKLTLVLKMNDKERLRQVPWFSLIASQNGGIWKQVDPFVVNWQASYIRANAAITGTYAWPLLIYSEWATWQGRAA